MMEVILFCVSKYISVLNGVSILYLKELELFYKNKMSGSFTRWLVGCTDHKGMKGGKNANGVEGTKVQRMQKL